MNIQQCMMSKHGWCNKAFSFRRCTALKPSQSPPESHSSVSSINILITTQRYLLGVKKKGSVSAPSIICSIFRPCWGRCGPSQGRFTKAQRYVPRKHGWNLAPGQMGILSSGGGWNVFFVGGSVMCWREEGGLSQCQTLPPALCSWEMYMWCKHEGSWWKHEAQAEITELNSDRRAVSDTLLVHAVSVLLSNCAQYNVVQIIVLFWALKICVLLEELQLKKNIKMFNF